MNPKPLIVDNIRGLYSRKESSNIPKGFTTTADNLVCGDGSVGCRSGLTASITDARWATVFSTRAIDVNDTTAFFVLAVNAGVTKFYYCKTGVNTEVLNPAPTGCSDFSFIRFFDTYIISFHDGQNGTGNVYVFNPAIHAVLRTAGCAAATTQLLLAAGAGGTKNVSAGWHIFTTVFETDTGFYSPATNVNAYNGIVASGTTKVNATNIPTGPTGTVARRIYASKTVPLFDGNVLVPEIFFVARIADNVTTVLNGIEFYDSELVDSGDYLKDISPTLPAVSSVCQYGNRVIGAGQALGGTANLSPHVAWATSDGKPETLDTTSGYITADPAYGQSLQCIAEWKGYLVMIKDIGTYLSKDNGGDPNTWPVDASDKSFGGGPQSICRSYASQPGTIEECLLILTTSGIKVFQGTYVEIPLTKNIDGLFESLIAAITATEFKSWQFFSDPINRFIYVSVQEHTNPLESYVIVGDYRDGLTPDNIKWTIFRFWHNGSNNSQFSCIGTLPRSTAEGGGLFLAKGNSAAHYMLSSSVVQDNGTYFGWDLVLGELPYTGNLTRDYTTTCRVLCKKNDSAGTDANVSIGDLSTDLQVTFPTVAPFVLQFKQNFPAVRPSFRMHNVAATGATRAVLDYIKRIVIYGSAAEVESPQ